jgi:hypothetical protein
MAGWPFSKARRRADRMMLKLQAVVEAIRHDYPAAASDVADAGIVIGRLAAALNEGDGE